MLQRFFTTLLLVSVFWANTGQFDIDHYYDPYDSHPRLMVKNGHLIVLTGRNKDIIFRSSGSGQIKINGNDPLASKISSLNQPDTSVDTRGVDIQRMATFQRNIQARIDQLSGQFNASLKMLQTNSATKTMRRLRRLTRRLKKIERLLNKNECNSNPCQHGGTCEDGYNRYFCRCAQGFKGTNCEQDVDECAHYAGTELGCQNGGTCLNTFGSFHCLCPSDYQGVRCTIHFDDCRNVSNHDLCGNGLCVNLARTQSGVARYRCVCFEGFAKSQPNSDSAPCDVDVDECALGIHHCSKNPKVTCINTVSGYSCGPCPTGYSGDGYVCTPIDLCLVNNGGCSLSPRVACFYLDGQVQCGSCPPGYAGDGFVCNAIDGNICTTNNGGCSPNANCEANPMISATFRTCTCLAGFSGRGIGPDGCRPVATLSCANSPCRNFGTCVESSGKVTCICLENLFMGEFCEKPVKLCDSNPCKNGGACVERHGFYNCICQSEYIGVNCEQERDTCGGVLDYEAGMLSYPLTNGTYANNVTCVWVIQNSNAIGRVLNITFTRFNLEHSIGCVFDMLEIFDGPTREFPRIGRYCGDTLPRNGNIITSFNSIYLSFRSDPYFAQEGFALNWLTTDPVCGGVLVNQTHGVIQSPGYPHRAQARLDCYWEIIAEYGKRIQFLFTNLDIQSSSNCSNNFIEFKEGISALSKYTDDDSNVINKFCYWPATPEKSPPEPITTAGSFARIHFRTDLSMGEGFQLVYNQIQGVCGGLLAASTGLFQPPSTVNTSPSGKPMLVYEKNLVCDWLIRVQPDERISLRFLSFKLEPDLVLNRRNNRTNSCMFDYVEVYDGQDLNAPLRARLCGLIPPPEIISTGRFLRVKFRSDSTVSLSGFVAKYTALCGADIEGSEGTFESPNYPAPLLVSRNCTYRINVPLGYIVRFEILEMDIELDRKCLFDYVQIEGDRYCGQLPPPPIYSMSNEMSILYVNDEVKPSRGFRAKYKMVEVGCGGVIKQGGPLMVISPDRIIDDPPQRQCLWEIRANSSFVVKLKFSLPETVASPNVAALRTREILRNRYLCNLNYILVNDSDGSLIRKFCLDELPPPIISSAEKIFITYVFEDEKRKYNNATNGTNNPNEVELHSYPVPKYKLKMFYANYYFIPVRRYCDKNYFKNTGIIQSPRFPKRYPKNRNCTWVIHVENGLQIRLNFTTFKVESESLVHGKCYDYLEIRNGRQSDSPLVGKFCGHGPMPEIVSHSNYLYLRFISDVSLEDKGFKLQYEATATGCGGTLTAESGSIESPGYPNHYFSNMNCEWRIRVGQGSRISLTIVSIDIESNSAESECKFDFLEFFDGESDSAKSLGKFCHDLANVKQTVITSSSNQMFLRFVTDSTLDHGGFKLNYRTDCNQILSGRYGVIESPNYPDPHSHNLNCNWHILAPLGNNITVKFTSLVLETGPGPGFDCRFDYVNITEVTRPRPFDLSRAKTIGTNSNYQLQTKETFCGNRSSKLPPPIKTNRNEIIITFVSDDTRSFKSGFRLEWAAIGCGGEYKFRSEGYITSPNFPNPYPHEVECLWHIRAPPGNRVDLTIHTLDLEFSQNCIFDYLRIFAGPDENSPQVMNACNQATDLKISSVGDAMTIKLISDLSSTARGFNATFETVQKGCGGTYTGSEGVIVSPNYGRGNQYDVNSDCEYSIQTNGAFNVEITINDLNIPKADNCSKGYLALYDAVDDGSEQRLLAKLCGGMDGLSGAKFNSTNSVLFLRFKSDGQNSGRGFNISFHRICGKTILVDDSEGFKEVVSPDYPHFNIDDTQCHFIFKAAIPGNALTLRFAHLSPYSLYFSLEESCNYSYALVYEGGETVGHKLIDRFCTYSIPRPTVSSGDTLTLVSHMAIFRVLVSSVKSFCGGDFNSIEGFITNPGYPNSYPLNIECIWTLKAPPGISYGLRIDDFNLEASDFCNGDYLEIRQQNSSGPLVTGQRLCGTDPPEVNVNFAGDIWIKFRSDDAEVAKGFLMYFYISPISYLSGENGFISSPGYPENIHIVNRTFTYVLTVPRDRFIRLDFTEFNIMGDNSVNCQSKLIIYDGLVDFSQMSDVSDRTQVHGLDVNYLPEPKAAYCGRILPPTFVSTMNAITISLILTNNIFVTNRFLIEWTAVNSSINYSEESKGIPPSVNSTFSVFIENGQTFSLLSENYTDYGNDITWYFQTPSWMRMNVSVSQLSFTHSFSCWHNKMTLHTWSASSEKWSLLKSVCNAFSGQILVNSSNLLRIHLQHMKYNDGFQVKPSYNLTVKPVCGGTLEDPSGWIELKKLMDDSSKECRWAIRVREGRTIQLTIDYLFIGTGRTIIECQEKNVLEIRNGFSSESPLLTKPLCGLNSTSANRKIPETSSNGAFLIYRGTFSKNDFRIRYEEVGVTCGGELRIHKPGDSVIVTSPEYPDSPSHDVICEWIVQGPLDYGLKLQFIPEKWSVCDSNISYIEIYDGGSELSTLVDRYCVPSFTINSVLIPNHITFIRYVLKNRDFLSRFNATITVDDCDREYFVDNMMFQTYQFPPPGRNQKFFSGTSAKVCTFRLRTHANFNIKVRVASVALLGQDCTSGDVIEFRDSNLGPTFKRICPPANESESSITATSKSNQLYISYRRQNLPNAKADLKVGITFTVESTYKNCIKFHNLGEKPTGRVVFPLSSNNVEDRIYCSWYFYAEPGNRIQLNFNRFQLGSFEQADLTDAKCPKLFLIYKNVFARPSLIEQYGCSPKVPAVVESKSYAMLVTLYANDLGAREGFSFSYKSIPDNDTCGDYLDQPRGTILSKDFYNPNSTDPVGCIWQMKLNSNQTGTFLLDSYNMGNNCSKGAIYGATFQGRYQYQKSICVISPEYSRQGKKYLIPFTKNEANNNQYYVVFNSDRSEPNKYPGLRGEYFLQNCGGLYNEFEGEFSSINYPSAYPTDTFCHWNFVINSHLSGYKLTFIEFDIGPNCDEDYFYIKPHFELLINEKICNTGQPPPPIYINHDLALTFVSSRNLSLNSAPLSPSSSESKVRKFRFKIEKATHGCGGQLVSASGSFHSPNYGQNERPAGQSSQQYPANTECIWLLKAQPDFHFKFTFNSRFDLETSANCTADYILFEERHTRYVDGDESGEEWREVRKLCGHETPKSFASVSGVVRATFRSNEKIFGNGFEVDFVQECGGIIEQNSGFIYSPHYATVGNYGNGQTCVYVIQRSPSEYISLEFEDFDLEWHSECAFDSLDVYFGSPDNKSAPHQGPFCGKKLPPPLNAPEMMSIVFRSDHYITKRGFKLRFNVTHCGGELNATQGIIHSPSILDKAGVYCNWKITVPDPKATVTLRIVGMDLANSNCRYDCCNSLKIYDGDWEGYSSEATLAYICDNSPEGFVFKSTANRMSVQFFHGYLFAPKLAKFELTFRSSLGPEHGCGGTFSQDSQGVITSPDTDGDSNYEPNLDCLWTITAPNRFEQLVSLEFERFDVEGNETGICDKDYVEIYDGSSLNAQILGKFCGRQLIPDKIVSSTGALAIQFITDGNGTGHGFRARFKIEERTCGGLVISNQTKQTLTSPNYPSGYDFPLHCTWQFRSSSFYESALFLYFEDLDLNCTRGDFVRVVESQRFTRESVQYRPLTFCSSAGPVKVKINNRVSVTMKANSLPASVTYDQARLANQKQSKQSYRGFKLVHHLTSCNESLEGPDNGFFSNREYPSYTSVYKTSSCMLNITVPEGRQIALYFGAFQFYHCHYSNMTVFEANSTKIKAVYCDTSATPSPYFSRSNRISILVQSSYALKSRDQSRNAHSNLNRLIYALAYSSSLASDGPTGCGGNFSSLTGFFTSPNYPNTLNENRMCTWLIHPAGFHTVTLKIDFFLLSPPCSTNYLAIYDGNEALEEKKLAQFCADDKPAPIRSTEGSLLVKLATTPDNYEPGFKASYKVNVIEPNIQGRIIHQNSFKYYNRYNTYTEF